MGDIMLATIPEPSEVTRSVVMGVAPFFTGTDDTNLLCGSCNTRLATGILNGQIRNIVLRCPTCNSYCEQIPPPPLAVPEGHIVSLTKGTFNFSAPVVCRPDVAVVGS